MILRTLLALAALIVPVTAFINVGVPSARTMEATGSAPALAAPAGLFPLPNSTRVPE